MFSDLRVFLEALERQGQLARVRVEVDPKYEITELATRTVKRQGPALLFERVRGSPYPLLINLLGTDRRVELALGRHPQQVGDELRRLIEVAMPPRPRAILDEWRSVARVLAMRPRRQARAAAQEVDEAPDLRRLPIMTCWPKDAGRFITCGMVLTQDPDKPTNNLGIYRMQVAGPDRVAMHWQIAKGGGFHYFKAEQRNQPLPVAVVIGADPILYLSAVLPLPEGIDELAFAGFLRGRPTRLAPCKSIPLSAPADAQIILEGEVAPHERMDEGPFGDHFGHYSHAAPFPILRITRVTRRRHPIYLSAVVGKPPQEDKYMGNAVQEIMLPLVKLIHPELVDVWAYYEAGFHSLAVISVIQRFGKEGKKTALGLLGEGQMALTKCLVIVDGDVNARDVDQVLRAIRDQFDPAEDVLLLPGVPFDTLDFTSLTLNVGSKIVLDATRRAAPTAAPGPMPSADDIARLHPRIRASTILGECLAVAQVEGEGRSVVEALVAAPSLRGMKLIAAVSADVDLRDRESVLWGIFTRFDPARDVVFTEASLKGSWPVYRGRLGIDATFKPGYPDPIEMDPAVVKRVDERWRKYWAA